MFLNLSILRKSKDDIKAERKKFEESVEEEAQTYFQKRQKEKELWNNQPEETKCAMKFARNCIIISAPLLIAILVICSLQNLFRMGLIAVIGICIVWSILLLAFSKNKRHFIIPLFILIEVLVLSFAILRLLKEIIG